MRRTALDAMSAAGLLLLCAELFRQTFHFRVPPFATMSSAVWPRLILGALAVLSLAMLVRSVHQLVREGAQTATPALPPHRNALICFALFAAFVAVLPWLGMLIGGVFFVFAMQEAIGPHSLRSRLTHLAVAILSVGGMWALFTFALRVILPEGVLLRF